jgi:hypothetical protein
LPGNACERSPDGKKTTSNVPRRQTRENSPVRSAVRIAAAGGHARDSPPDRCYRQSQGVQARRNCTDSRPSPVTEHAQAFQAPQQATAAPAVLVQDLEAGQVDVIGTATFVDRGDVARHLMPDLIQEGLNLR